MKLDMFTKDKLDKDQVELVQKKKHEYKLLSSFSRRKGTRLYQYNPKTEELIEVEVKHSDTIHAFFISGKWVTVDFEQQKSVVDSRMVYFEAIRLDSAKDRVIRYKHDLNAMCNLVPVKGGCITLF